MLQDFKSQFGQSMSSMRQFLQKPIQLNGGHLELGMSKSSLRTQAREESRKRVRHMKRDLYALLRQHPSSRGLMRHLATVEHALHTDGLKGFEALPVRVIARALAEMEGLVRDWSPTGLAELRSRMAVIVKARPGDVLELAAKGPTTPGSVSVHADLAGPGDVSEVDHAEFEEMERSWVGVVPTERSAQQPATA
jgi:hypothetical protein